MKSAIYIEQKIKGSNQLLGWAAYVYAPEKDVQLDDYTFVKQAKDQWGKTVKVYKAKEVSYMETPGGVKKTDLVVLFENQPVPVSS